MKVCEEVKGYLRSLGHTGIVLLYLVGIYR